MIDKPTVAERPSESGYYWVKISYLRDGWVRPVGWTLIYYDATVHEFPIFFIGNEESYGWEDHHSIVTKWVGPLDYPEE